MRIDPAAQARRLLASLNDQVRSDLADDPFTTVETQLAIAVISRPSIPGPGCAVDGTYKPGPPPQISVATDVVEARQRFTLLHELGHHLIEHDDLLNDLDLDSDRRDEDICNEVAAQLLLPDELVQQIVGDGPLTARVVAELYEASNASRMACCVAAARRLLGSGCVMLGDASGVAVFTAHHPATPWRVGRNTSQGNASLLAKAGAAPSGRARDVTVVRFAAGNESGPVHGDAFCAADGWVYLVVAADSHAPWQTGLRLGLDDTIPEPESFECVHCGEETTTWSTPCRKCSDRRCPRCGRCSCPSGPPRQQCDVCFNTLPINQFRGTSKICTTCE